MKQLGNNNVEKRRGYFEFKNMLFEFERTAEKRQNYTYFFILSVGEESMLLLWLGVGGFVCQYRITIWQLSVFAAIRCLIKCSIVNLASRTVEMKWLMTKDVCWQEQMVFVNRELNCIKRIAEMCCWQDAELHTMRFFFKSILFPTFKETYEWVSLKYNRMR